MGRHPSSEELEEFRSNPLAAIYIKVAALDARLTMALRIGGAIGAALLTFVVAVSVTLVSDALGGPGPGAVRDAAVAVAQAVDQAVAAERR